jgi:endonuclease G
MVFLKNLTLLFLFFSFGVFACPQPKDFEPILINKNISVVCHDDWVSWYDTDNLIPSFSFYQVYGEKTKMKNTKRPTVFTLDPTIPKEMQARSSWFTRSGYDRGHLFPNDDGNYSLDVSRRTFYMTNVVPQTPELNRGIWKSLEEDIRGISLIHNVVDVYIFVYYETHMNKTKELSMAVPYKFVKIYKVNEEYFGFSFDNTNNPQATKINIDNDTLKELNIRIK